MDLPELTGVSLVDSYILGWNSAAGTLVFEIDFVLEPTHPEYSKPLDGEWACFRRGTLMFADVTSIRGLPAIDDTPFNVGPDDEIDYGNIDALELVDGTYRFDLEFCTAWIEASAIEIKLN